VCPADQVDSISFPVNYIDNFFSSEKLSLSLILNVDNRLTNSLHIRNILALYFQALRSLDPSTIAPYLCRRYKLCNLDGARDLSTSLPVYVTALQEVHAINIIWR
jgi:hypothetical protein